MGLEPHRPLRLCPALPCKQYCFFGALQAIVNDGPDKRIVDSFAIDS